VVQPMPQSWSVRVTTKFAKMKISVLSRFDHFSFHDDRARHWNFVTGIKNQEIEMCLIEEF
jgi:hypothetical protein